MKQASLYIIPTPIGNLKDITLRAIETLKEVDIVCCEDTRVTSKLLNHYDIPAKTMSYHKFSEKEKAAKIVELIKNGNSVALVSDAGTPLISDPGCELIKECKKENINIIPLPGACAFITAISAVENSGKLLFYGFLPRKDNEQKKIFETHLEEDIIFYESPNRLIDTLKNIEEVRPSAKVSVGRELTKIYEEIKTFNVSEMIEHYTKNTLKGEIVGIIHAEEILKDEEISTEIINYAKDLSKEGFSTKDISKILSIIFKIPKNKLYSKISMVI